jgi:hypothetical protein
MSTACCVVDDSHYKHSQTNGRPQTFKVERRPCLQCAVVNGPSEGQTEAGQQIAAHVEVHPSIRATLAGGDGPVQTPGIGGGGKECSAHLGGNNEQTRVHHDCDYLHYSFTHARQAVKAKHTLNTFITNITRN